MSDDAVVEVITADELQSRVAEIGEEITKAYAGRTPVLVGVLAGSVPFLADLVRHIDLDIDVDFISLSRFGEGGRVRLVLDTETSVFERDVLIVEDIIDTGLTLSVMQQMFAARGVASVEVATLLNKPSRRIVDAPIAHRGFDVGDEFLLGYGLDWEGRYRNLRSMWAVMDFDRFVADPDELGRRVFVSPGDRLEP